MLPVQRTLKLSAFTPPPGDPLPQLLSIVVSIRVITLGSVRVWLFQ